MMRCNCPTKSTTLRFLYQELLYDIKNYCYIESDQMPEGDEHSRHQVSDVGEAGNVDRVNRVLALAFHDIQETLYPYTKRNICCVDEYNNLYTQESYDLELTLPKDFSETTLELLKHLIHEYMVSKVVADWMSIVKPSSKENWEQKAVQMRQRIQTSVMNRTGIVKRKLSVF